MNTPQLSGKLSLKREKTDMDELLGKTFGIIGYGNMGAPLKIFSVFEKYL